MKISFKNEEAIETLSDEEKLKEFVNSRFTLKEMLKEDLEERKENDIKGKLETMKVKGRSTEIIAI